MCGPWIFWRKRTNLVVSMATELLLESLRVKLWSYLSEMWCTSKCSSDSVGQSARLLPKLAGTQDHQIWRQLKRFVTKGLRTCGGFGEKDSQRLGEYVWAFVFCCYLRVNLMTNLAKMGKKRWNKEKGGCFLKKLALKTTITGVGDKGLLLQTPMTLVLAVMSLV
jgi:hypothetical protein